MIKAKHWQENEVVYINCWKLKWNWRSRFQMKHLGPTALAEHWYVVFFKFCSKNVHSNHAVAFRGYRIDATNTCKPGYIIRFRLKGLCVMHAANQLWVMYSRSIVGHVQQINCGSCTADQLWVMYSRSIVGHVQQLQLWVLYSRSIVCNVQQINCGSCTTADQLWVMYSRSIVGHVHRSIVGHVQQINCGSCTADQLWFMYNRSIVNHVQQINNYCG